MCIELLLSIPRNPTLSRSVISSDNYPNPRCYVVDGQWDARTPLPWICSDTHPKHSASHGPAIRLSPSKRHSLPFSSTFFISNTFSGEISVTKQSHNNEG